MNMKTFKDWLEGLSSWEELQQDLKRQGRKMKRDGKVFIFTGRGKPTLSYNTER